MASGSDDGKVKIWTLNAPQSVCTIDAKVNVSLEKNAMEVLFFTGLLRLFLAQIQRSGGIQVNDICYYFSLSSALPITVSIFMISATRAKP